MTRQRCACGLFIKQCTTVLSWLVAFAAPTKTTSIRVCAWFSGIAILISALKSKSSNSSLQYCVLPNMPVLPLQVPTTLEDLLSRLCKLQENPRTLLSVLPSFNRRGSALRSQFINCKVVESTLTGQASVLQKRDRLCTAWCLR